jgi:hypothetical protein
VRRVPLLLVGGTLALTTPARAQRPDAHARVIPAAALEPVWKRPWIRPLASLTVPGTGQLLGGRDRGVVYLVAEVWFGARALALARQGRTQRAYFQTLAYDVARRPFTATRRDGPFEYYETMSHYVESGAYNLGGPSGFQPETDTLTFNGAMWLLARQTFFENPDSIPAATSAAYQAALAFYRRRAYGDDFRWSWRDARLEMDVFRQAIRASDQGYREATNYLGAILINHLTSAVDAFITTRLGVRGAVPRTSVLPDGQGFVVVWHWAL